MVPIHENMCLVWTDCTYQSLARWMPAEFSKYPVVEVNPPMWRQEGEKSRRGLCLIYGGTYVLQLRRVPD